MKTPHDLISGLAQALNTRDEGNLINFFPEDAVIRDGGLQFSGHAGIRHWIQTAIDRYGLKMRILGVSGQDGEWIFDALLSGTFEGSPVRVEHCLTIEDGKIAHLDI